MLGGDNQLAIRSLAYDLVLNGWELGSGSVRIHRREVQEQVLVALGISPARILSNAYGETRPSVDTPDGMVEPRNRRVEVVVGPAPAL